MSRCLGFPECTGTAGNELHQPKCPMYVAPKQVEEITEPLPPRNVIDISKASLFMINKAVVADSVEDALKREKAGEGKVISISIHHD